MASSIDLSHQHIFRLVYESLYMDKTYKLDLISVFSRSSYTRIHSSEDPIIKNVYGIARPIEMILT